LRGARRPFWEGENMKYVYIVMICLCVLLAGCLPSASEQTKMLQPHNTPIGLSLFNFLVFVGAIAISFGVAAVVNGSLISKIIGGGICCTTIGILLLEVQSILSKYSGWIFLLLCLFGVSAFSLWLYHHFQRSGKIARMMDIVAQ
jgi:hypothetical protein